MFVSGYHLRHLGLISLAELTNITFPRHLFGSAHFELFDRFWYGARLNRYDSNFIGCRDLFLHPVVMKLSLVLATHSARKHIGVVRTTRNRNSEILNIGVSERAEFFPIYVNVVEHFLIRHNV